MMRHAGLLLLLPVLACGEVRGWGADGHRLAGEIAWLELTPIARERVLEILSRESAHYRYFSRAGLWADREGKRGPHGDTGRLHYVNVDPAATSVVLADACRDGCVISAIVRNASALMTRSCCGMRATSASRAPSSKPSLPCPSARTWVSHSTSATSRFV